MKKKTSKADLCEPEEEDKYVCGIINPGVFCIMKTELSITILTYRLI